MGRLRWRYSEGLLLYEERRRLLKELDAVRSKLKNLPPKWLIEKYFEVSRLGETFTFADAEKLWGRSACTIVSEMGKHKMLKRVVNRRDRRKHYYVLAK